MTEAATDAAAVRKPRVKIFGRTYDHATGTLKVAVAGKPEATLSAILSEFPPAVVQSFALMALADFAVGNGNAVANEGGTVEDAIKAISESFQAAKDGKVEFSEGMGLGMSSASATLLVGRALVDEGKKFVSWNGTKHEFEGDVGKAQEAMKALYNDTAERTLPNGTKMTGRQFFKQVSDVPAIAERVKSYKKAKGQNSSVLEAIG